MKMNHFLHKFGRGVASNKSRWVTITIWILLVLLLSMIWPQVNDEEVGGNNLLPDDSMSVEASKMSKAYFPNDSGNNLLIVWYREGGLNETDFQTVQSLYKELEKTPLNQQEQIPEFASIPVEVFMQAASEDGTTLTTPLVFNKEASTDELEPEIEKLKEKIIEMNGTNPFVRDIKEDGFHVRFTGPVGIQLDTTELFSQADVTLLIATVLLVLILLVVLYRSPILAIVPLIGVGVAYGLISPVLGFMARQEWIVVDAQTISIMTVLLFGAGTDYCLFLISRYREELKLEANKYKALQLAIAGSGGAIMMSALTTVLGLLTLSFARYGSYDRFAVPFSLAILIMGIAVLTLLPAILAILGRTAFFPFVPRTEQMTKELMKKKGKQVRTPKERSKFSRVAGKLVTESPWKIIIICFVFLGGLALFVPKIDYTYGVFDSFPEDMPSREGFTILSDHYPGGELAPTNVILDTEGLDIDLEEKLVELDGIASVSEPIKSESQSNLWQFTLSLSVDPYSNQAVKKIEDIKELSVEVLKDAGIKNASEKVWIGGETATLYDTEKTTSRDQSIIIPAVLLIIAALLLVYLRSVVAMIYLLVTVVLSYFSALGLGWLVIHYGIGSSAMQGLIPLYSFVFLVALGGDYNIFMISSIWKKRGHMPLKKAISEGVGETSSVISSAGLILAGTFSVLAVLPLQVLVQFGTVTAIGVLLDTFIVRPLLVPAITTVLGKYAFWPGKLWKQDNKEKQRS
nr:MMPL family transporter [Aquibacillus kalidii]